MSKDTQTITKTDKVDNINIMKEINYIIECKTPTRTSHPVPPNAPKKIKRHDFWYGEEGKCEICGIRDATINLDLTCGSHRECQSCWED
jgi:hypothetical protein